MSEPVKPVALRSPVGRRRFANGRTTAVSGSDARSRAGMASAKVVSSASSYSSGASVGAHQTRKPSSDRKVWSQWPAEFGRRSPISVAAIAATRRADGVSVDPM